MPSDLDFETSCVKRTQREHRMQRSLSSTIRSESGWNFVNRSFGSTEIEGAPLYA
jgi:hypothetical protein